MKTDSNEQNGAETLEHLNQVEKVSKGKNEVTSNGNIFFADVDKQLA